MQRQNFNQHTDQATWPISKPMSHKHGADPIRSDPHTHTHKRFRASIKEGEKYVKDLKERVWTRQFKTL